jgi:hypothetical protein
MNKEVQTFINSAEPGRRDLLEEVGHMIVSPLPHAEESFNGDFPCTSSMVNGSWVCKT